MSNILRDFDDLKNLNIYFFHILFPAIFFNIQMDISLP